MSIGNVAIVCEPELLVRLELTTPRPAPWSRSFSCCAHHATPNALDTQALNCRRSAQIHIQMWLKCGLGEGMSAIHKFNSA
ncbi:hypothetical protein K432DRAFT_156012 [Lepidopterella palustris CBS 459.81]|uniref:Uncharacterized protein n=1 Tax=Lepidopterella palustris CBS 459.81 TaxID=1314670 RepID=A0A8E2E294_9PEZI|nr:hypothetical protein K432DRAFT_156012 [Lepidopterella palustris CBS 459.81]